MDNQLIKSVHIQTDDDLPEDWMVNPQLEEPERIEKHPCTEKQAEDLMLLAKEVLQFASQNEKYFEFNRYYGDKYDPIEFAREDDNHFEWYFRLFPDRIELEIPDYGNLSSCGGYHYDGPCDCDFNTISIYLDHDKSLIIERISDYMIDLVEEDIKNALDELKHRIWFEKSTRMKMFLRLANASNVYKEKK